MSKLTVNPQNKSVRMSDVARLAKVSSMTVSRALKAPETVSEETRERISAAIEQTGYIPNRLAGNLSSQHSNVVGLVFPSLRNSLFSETIQTTAETLGKAGFHVLIAESGHSLAEEEKLVTAFLGQRVSGIVLHNTTHTERLREMLMKSDVPVVETGDLTRNPIDLVVSYSNYDAARAMTDYLYGRGYRRIAFMSLETRDNDRMRERRRAFIDALEALGEKPDLTLITETESGLAGGRDGLARLLAADNRPDAVFCSGDVLAVGAALECQRRSLKMPSDIAIASFDDLDIHDHLVPTLTSLRLPRGEIGAASANILLQRILRLDPVTTTTDLGFDIIQREST